MATTSDYIGAVIFLLVFLGVVYIATAGTRAAKQVAMCVGVSSTGSQHAARSARTSLDKASRCVEDHSASIDAPSFAMAACASRRADDK